MKVKFERNYKMFYTVEEYEQAKAVIAYEKENDDFTPKDWAEYALTALCSYHGWSSDDVIEAHAVTCKGKPSAYEYFGEGSGHMGIKIEGIGRIYNKGTAYVEFSGFLSDIAKVGDETQFNGSMVYYRLFLEQ